MSRSDAAAETADESSLAIVGMAGRFPGASSIDEFWELVKSGHEAIEDLTDETLMQSGIPEEVFRNPAYIRRAPVLADVEAFDADFFGFSPRAAQHTDPQQRLFLQTAWHALEDACCDPYSFLGSIGVFASTAASGYLLHNLLSHSATRDLVLRGANVDLISLMIQNDKDYLATRVSHQFNLRGPSLTIQTACSSSLVAVHAACQSLLTGESDVALAGGVSIRIPHQAGYTYESGSMVSATGHCRPFDAKADGTIFGSGVGIVVIKRVSDAIAAGNLIHAVIAGSAVNNDGSKKIAFSAPNVAAQAEVIVEAQAIAGVDPADISYIETHGTGTPLGDPIEVEALRRAFGVSGQKRLGPCVLGAVKANIGHLEVASGVVGLIKTVLCLKHRAIPPALYFDRPNPELNLGASPFEVAKDYRAWDFDGPRYAGVSSFGVGGTNAHVVLGEAPAPACLPARSVGSQVLVVSGHTREAVEANKQSLANYLTKNTLLDVADVAHTLSQGRRAHQERTAVVASGLTSAAAALRRTTKTASALDPSDSCVVLLFPGQGTQHHRMAYGLLAEPVFAEAFDRCTAGFLSLTGQDIRGAIYGGGSSRLRETLYTQPALFCVEYALAKLLAAYGIVAEVLIGHSIGEYVAAVLAGVFELDDAIKVVAIRSELMNASPEGAMLAVAHNVNSIRDRVTGSLDIAAINDPQQCVVSGGIEEIAAFHSWCNAQGIQARKLQVSNGFHSRLMDSIVPEFAAALQEISLSSPQKALFSNETGALMTAEQAVDPTTWAQSVRATVRFSDAVSNLLEQKKNCIFVEAGPGGSLTASVKRQTGWSQSDRAVRLMRRPEEGGDDREVFLDGLGQLWAAGQDVDWSSLSAPSPQWVTLPSYSFGRKSYWIDPVPTNEFSQAQREMQSANSTSQQPASDTSRDPATGTADGDLDKTEALLTDLWKDVLGLDHIDTETNFFDLGVDSLVALGFVRRSGEAGIPIEPHELLEHQTVRSLARVVHRRRSTAAPVSLEPREDERQSANGDLPVSSGDFATDMSSLNLDEIAQQLSQPLGEEYP